MLTRVLRRTKLAGRLRAVWRQEADEAIKPLRKDLRRLTAEVEELRATLQHTAIRAARGDRSASQLRLILELDEQQRERLAALPALLDERQIQAHVSQAIGAAELHSEPFEHIVVEQVLPAAVYELLIAAIPPAVFFDDHDPVKQNLAFPITFGPALPGVVWNFVDAVIRTTGYPAGRAREVPPATPGPLRYDLSDRRFVHEPMLCPT